MWFRLEASLCGPGWRRRYVVQARGTPIRPVSPLCGPCRRRPYVVQAERAHMWSRMEVLLYGPDWDAPMAMWSWPEALHQAIGTATSQRDPH